MDIYEFFPNWGTVHIVYEICVALHNLKYTHNKVSKRPIWVDSYIIFCLTSILPHMELKVNNSVPNHNGNLCFYISVAPTLQSHPHPLCIIILLYYHYISAIKWSSNDNNIVYRDYFWDNISSNKSSYHDRPKYEWFDHKHLVLTSL